VQIVYLGRGDSPVFDSLGATRVGLDKLVAESDVVSLHVPPNPQTHHVIDASALARMKPTAYLINTARGPVVDEVALVAALRAGTIAGAGLDVYEHEPSMAPGLADCPHTLLLPHLGSATIATRAAMSRMAAENVVAALDGLQPPDLVNPEGFFGAER
jgi:glyoxylate reductase